MISTGRVPALVHSIVLSLKGMGGQTGWRVSILAGLIFLGTGCARVSSPPLEEMPALELSSAQMLEIMESSYDHTSLQALAEVHLRRGNDKQSSTQALHVQAPYKLRAEVYNFMGQLLVMLTADGAGLEAYVPSRKVLYRGMATRGRMEQFAYVPLMPADMVALLMLRLPPGVLQLAQVEKKGNNSLRFILSAQQEYVVHFGIDQVERIAYHELGQEVFSIAYSNVSPTGNGAEKFPRRMDLVMPLQDMELDIELEDVQLNPVIEPALFEIEVTAGIEIVPLEDL